MIIPNSEECAFLLIEPQRPDNLMVERATPHLLNCCHQGSCNKCSSFNDQTGMIQKQGKPPLTKQTSKSI